MGFPTDFWLKFAAGKDEESFGKSQKIMHWTSHESSKQKHGGKMMITLALYFLWIDMGEIHGKCHEYMWISWNYNG